MKKILSLLLLLFVVSSAFAQQKKTYVTIMYSAYSTSKDYSLSGDVPQELKDKKYSDIASAMNSLAAYGFVFEHSFGYSHGTNTNTSKEVYIMSKEVNDSSNSNSRLRGDVNEDGRVSISDATEVVDIILNPEEKK